jgi:ABC-type protease/lipase transport system fused ATPase/permease subunit
VRGRILQRIGVWLEQRLSMECLRRTLTMPPGTDSYGTQALRDVTQLRQTIGSPVVTALLDVARAHLDFQSSP